MTGGRGRNGRQNTQTLTRKTSTEADFLLNLPKERQPFISHDARRRRRFVSPTSQRPDQRAKDT